VQVEVWKHRLSGPIQIRKMLMMFIVEGMAFATWQDTVPREYTDACIPVDEALAQAGLGAKCQPCPQAGKTPIPGLRNPGYVEQVSQSADGSTVTFRHCHVCGLAVTHRFNPALGAFQTDEELNNVHPERTYLTSGKSRTYITEAGWDRAKARLTVSSAPGRLIVWLHGGAASARQIDRAFPGATIVGTQKGFSILLTARRAAEPR
jgi:hypothetical protein